MGCEPRVTYRCTGNIVFVVVLPQYAKLCMTLKAIEQIV
jgi:hypothetical protein